MDHLKRATLMLMTVAFLPLPGFLASAADRQDESAELSTSDLHDVAALLEFTHKAYPEDFDPFMTSIESVTQACYSGIDDGEVLEQIMAMEDEIIEIMPKRNRGLIMGLRLISAFKKDVSMPTLKNKGSLRENVLIYMADLRRKYAGQDFDGCAHLITYAAEILLDPIENRFATSQN